MKLPLLYGKYGTYVNTGVLRTKFLKIDNNCIFVGFLQCPISPVLANDSLFHKQSRDTRTVSDGPGRSSQTNFDQTSVHPWNRVRLVGLSVIQNHQIFDCQMVRLPEWNRDQMIRQQEKILDGAKFLLVEDGGKFVFTIGQVNWLRKCVCKYSNTGLKIGRRNVKYTVFSESAWN